MVSLQFLFNVSAILHEILTKLEIVMEQQRHLVRMVQDLKENNVCEITEENHLTPKYFPVEDLRSLTSLESDLRSSPETRRKVVGETNIYEQLPNAYCNSISFSNYSY